MEASRQIPRYLLVALICAIGLCPSGVRADVAAEHARDVVLFLDTGPVHLRFHIRLHGKSVEQSRSTYIEQVMTELDANKDGSITRKETLSSPLFNARRRVATNPFVATLDANQKLTRRDIKLNIDRIGGATVVYRQDESTAETDLAVFKVIDADGSGKIETREMRNAAALIAALDRDRDQCIGFDEFLPESVPADEPPPVVVQQPAQRQPVSQPAYSELMRDTRERLLPRRILRKYDRNRDGQLTAKELGWSAARLSTLDENQDGRLTHRELTRIAASPVDLELAVELSGEGTEPPLAVIAAAGNRRIPAPRPDLVRLTFGKTSVTFSFRKIAPIQSATNNAMRTFNQIDVDANGYIDRKEIADRFRFERYLFEAIDMDGDEKLFAEEMKKYVTIRGQPAATSCRVNIYNTGNGFFQTLDASGDGRISIRELRMVEKRLLASARPPGTSLSPDNAGHKYHVEFVRGSYQLFGRSDRMVFQGPTFIQRPPIGPIWFQRMDRNSDGDLTWQEFLGPRDAFHQLDIDQDGLIDHQEAERADEN